MDSNKCMATGDLFKLNRDSYPKKKMVSTFTEFIKAGSI